MQGSSPRLDIRNLTRRVAGKTLVQDVSLAIEPGQVTCLLGPSGCGKSTTLRMVAGIERPNSGEIYVDGDLICSDGRSTPPEQRKIGLMFQDFALFPHLSVAGNVGFGLQGSKAERRARVSDLLERVGLVKLIDMYPHELSGGEQQRIALARALAPRPRIMLMDEPFSGLDNRLRDGIRDETLALLKDEGTAVLLVTHEPEEAMRMADQIALMRAGKIVQIGAPYNIYKSPADKRAVAFFSDINVIRSQVTGALAQTPFGRFLAPGVEDGAEVDIVFRPQHVGIDFDRAGNGPHPTHETGTPARGLVTRARFLGSESLVDFRMDCDGSTLTAKVPNVFLPKQGTPFWLTIRRDRCFVFAAED